MSIEPQTKRPTTDSGAAVMNLKTKTIDNPDFIGNKLLCALQERFEQLSMSMTPQPVYATVRPSHPKPRQRQFITSLIRILSLEIYPVRPVNAMRFLQ
jgi:hypothetical protein